MPENSQLNAPGNEPCCRPLPFDDDDARQPYAVAPDTVFAQIAQTQHIHATIVSLPAPNVMTMLP